MTACHIITGLDDGGAQAALFRLVTAPWPEDRRHVVISLTGRGTYAERLERAGVVVHCLHMPRGAISLEGLSALYRLLRRMRPAVVQTWMYHADLIGGVVARLCGIRAVAWGIRNYSLDLGRAGRKTRMVARTCAALSPWICRKIVSCSARAAKLHEGLGYSADKFVVIPNGYPLDRLAPDLDRRTAVRDSLGLPAGLPVLGMVARLDPQKDHKNLIRALGMLKKRGQVFACLLVGDGIVQADAGLQDEIRQAGLEAEVRLLGPREDIPAIMNALDLHVLSSSSEAFPNVLAESMACGTPSVTTDVGDAALIVGDTGWVVPPQDSQALANAVSAALAARANVSAWRERQRLCRQRIVDNFSLDRMVAAYRQVWESISEP